MREIRKYSEAFKLQVLSEMESGELKSQYEARMRYDIRGHATVSKWIKKYGKAELSAKVVRVETTKERDQLKEMKRRIRELEHALSDAHLDLSLERAYVKLACKAARIEDVEGFKKNTMGGGPRDGRGGEKQGSCCCGVAFVRQGGDDASELLCEAASASEEADRRDVDGGVGEGGAADSAVFGRAEGAGVDCRRIGESRRRSRARSVF